MLTKEGCASRRRRLWDAVPADIEWLLIADPRHVNYLANFWVHPLSFSAGERALLLLERDNGATLFCDNMTVGSSASEPHCDRQVVDTWYDHRHSAPNRDHSLVNALRQVVPALAGRPGFVETEWLPVAAWEVLKEGDVRNHPADKNAGSLGTQIRALRRQKDPDELTLLRQCMRATDAGHARAWDIIRTGISEMDIFREVQSTALATAARPGLIYGDFRATTMKQPHLGGLPTPYRLQLGDLFILDYSVVLNGYRSDFTNTIAVGVPTMKQQETFQVCTAALRAGESVLKAGIARGRRLRRRVQGLYRCRSRTIAASRRPRNRPGPSRAADLGPRERRRPDGRRRRDARTGLLRNGRGRNAVRAQLPDYGNRRRTAQQSSHFADVNRPQRA